MSDYQFLRRDFLATSQALFIQVRTQIVQADSWTFSLEHADVAPEDLDPSSNAGPRASAAFMLRRIQALRYLVRDPKSIANPEAALGLASDTVHYLEWVESHFPSALDREVVRACHHATRSLLAYCVSASGV